MRLHSGLRLPDELKIRDASSSSEELVMAMRIIAFMSVLFKPERHRLQDIFKHRVDKENVLNTMKDLEP